MNDDGMGSVSNLIAALEWVAAQHRTSLRPSIISMNVRIRPGDIALDTAVQSVSQLGPLWYMYVIDCFYSRLSTKVSTVFSPLETTTPRPALFLLLVLAMLSLSALWISKIQSCQVPTSALLLVCLHVGNSCIATDILPDMYAPGVNVLSAWIGHPWASALQSGTSTAAPYVAGIAAYNLGGSSFYECCCPFAERYTLLVLHKQAFMARCQPRTSASSSTRSERRRLEDTLPPSSKSPNRHQRQRTDHFFFIAFFTFVATSTRALLLSFDFGSSVVNETILISSSGEL